MRHEKQNHGRTVRLHVDHPRGETERMWGLRLAVGRVRVLNLSAFSDLSFCDVVRAMPVCSCDDIREHYVAAERISRGSRRVQAFTDGTGRERLEEVAAYLATFPTTDGTSNSLHDVPPGWVRCGWNSDGLSVGVAAYPTLEPTTNDTHWRISFPLSASDEQLAAFLDELPYLAFHELEPDAEEEWDE